MADTEPKKTTKEAQELSPQDYLNKVKEAYEIKQNLEIKFIRDDQNVQKTVTTDDLIKKKKNALYFKGCKGSEYKVAQNVEIVKLLIEDCHDCTMDLRGRITTNVIELWRSNNLTLLIDTEVFTLQADLCNNLTVTYTHKAYLGSFVQAGIYGLNVKFVDYPDLNFTSGFSVLKETYPDINDKTDQFITRFVDGKLLTEMIVRLDNGFHTTEREKVQFDEQKEKDDKATEEAIRKMMKLAPQAVGVSEQSVFEKSKEGKAEQEEKNKRMAASNLKKNQGNKALTAGDSQAAVGFYTEAIEIAPENHLLYSNRSQAYMNLKDWEKALADASKCVELQSDFAKGHFKKGTILLELKRTEEAVKAFTEAHDLVPRDEEILNALNAAKDAIAAH